MRQTRVGETTVVADTTVPIVEVGEEFVVTGQVTPVETGEVQLVVVLQLIVVRQ